MVAGGEPMKPYRGAWLVAQVLNPIWSRPKLRGPKSVPQEQDRGWLKPRKPKSVCQR